MNGGRPKSACVCPSSFRSTTSATRSANSSAAGWHVVANRLLTTLSNLFTGLRLTDMETCYKVFRREIIQALAPRLREDRFGIEPELTAKAARGGYRIREVAVRYRGRTRQQGK